MSSASQYAGFGDPTTAPFWKAAAEKRLLIQKCTRCAHHQFYPRPICLACGSSEMSWVEVPGTGTVYSMTTMHVQLIPELEPPYVVAVIELDEGPRLLSNLVGQPCRIGDRVRLAWRERESAPPLPIFEGIPCQ